MVDGAAEILVLFLLRPPMFYRLREGPRLFISRPEGDTLILEGSSLPFDLSQRLFRRDRRVASIIVQFEK